MKKLSLLLCLIFSVNTFASCESYYQKASRKRAQTVMLISYGVGFASPALILLSGGMVMTTLAVTGMLGGYTNGKMNEFGKTLTTYGKVHRAMTGDPKQLGKKVAKYLKQDGVIVDREDPEFLNTVQTIAKELSHTEKACPYLGYDKKFQDIVKVYNFREFSEMVKEEYLKQAM